MQIPYSKNRYPFSLGCTSCVLPDTALANVKYLAPLVDDIELMFFETPNETNYPSRHELTLIDKILRKEGTSCTIHLPTDTVYEFLNGDLQTYFDSLLSVLETTKHLPSKAYVLHLAEDHFSPSKEELSQWTANCVELLRQLTQIIPIERIAVENLYYPWQWNSTIVQQTECSYALDLGHLWNEGAEWESAMNTMLPHCRVIQLHGSDKRDHSAITSKETSHLQKVVEITKEQHYSQIITCEVFGISSTVNTLNEVHRVWEKLY